MVHQTCVVHAQDVGAFFTESWVRESSSSFLSSKPL
jgi:hypothetical protein